MTTEDLFWALQRLNVIDEEQSFSTYEEDRPTDYYLFMEYWVPEILYNYGFEWNFFDYVADQYDNYYDTDASAEERRQLVVDYVLSLNPDYTEEEVDVYIALTNKTTIGGNR
jgi:hypothetical protein